jgi:hypothetical protein
MRISILVSATVLAAIPALAGAQDAAKGLCRQTACSVAFEWSGGNAPDPDRRYGSPGDLEQAFVSRLEALGFDIEDHAASVLTLRVTMENAAMCDAMPGTDTDMSCHTASRASVVFASSDPAVKAPAPVDVHPHCADPKILPKMVDFGRYAAEWTSYAAGGEKGTRPSTKC